MNTSTKTITTVDGPMDLYQALPDGAPSAAIIVIQEAFGLNDHIKDLAERFAKEGYHAVAPDIFHRSGGGVAAYDDFDKARSLFVGLSDPGIMVDVDATIEQLHADGFANNQIGIVGFCFGGRASFMVGARRDLGAAVTFYGAGISGKVPMPGYEALIDEAAGMRTPWLGLFGDQDPMITIENVEALRSAIVAAPVDTEIVRYADAGHGFNCDARPESYHEASAKDAWRRALAWFGARL